MCQPKKEIKRNLIPLKQTKIKNQESNISNIFSNQNQYPCFLGHYYKKSNTRPMITDLNNITHIVTECERCDAVQILHIDNKITINI